MDPSLFLPNCPGRLVKTVEDALAFVPNPLPPVLAADWETAAKASSYPLHEPRSSRSAQRAAFCAHDGKRDEVVGARSRVEGERAEGEGIRGGARVQGIHVGVLGQLPEARTDR